MAEQFQMLLYQRFHFKLYIVVQLRHDLKPNDVGIVADLFLSM